MVRRGEPVLLAGYGLARHRADVPFTPATPVQIGSNVKDFTATAVYQLIEGGRLRLDDSLQRFFPGLPADKRAITVHVFAPAGMTETGLALPRFATALVAHGYVRGQDRGTVLDLPRDADGHLWSLRGNGGMLSTLADMRRFYRALRDTVLLRSGEYRRAVVPLDEPGVWAGSDRVSVFAYASEPRDELEILVAGNHQDYPGGRVLRRLQEALGMPVPQPGDAAVAGPPLDRIPDEGVGSTVAAFVSAYNSGDTALMWRFYEQRMASSPGAPSLTIRLERYRDILADVGKTPGARGASAAGRTRDGAAGDR